MNASKLSKTLMTSALAGALRKLALAVTDEGQNV